MERRHKPFFSARTNFGAPDAAYETTREIARNSSGFLDLTLSSPAAAGVPLPHPLALLGDAPPHYTPDPRGLVEARRALARKYAARACVTEQNFVLTASTSEAYSFALTILCDPGDRILVPEPSYPLFEQLSRLAGVELVPYRIGYDGAFFTDLSTLPSPEKMAAKRIRAVCVVSPNNPTGHCLERAALDKMRSLEVPLIIDEVFRPYSWGKTGPDPLVDAHEHPLTIVLDGLSKRAGAPGLKLGWMLAMGTDAPALLERAEWVSDAFLSAGSLVQHALPRILEEEDKLQERILARLSAARSVLNEAPLHEAGISVLPTDGGFTALLRLPATLTEFEWWQEAAREGLFLQPGHLYGLAQTPSFALGLLTDPQDLELACGRLIELVRRFT